MGSRVKWRAAHAANAERIRRAEQARAAREAQGAGPALAALPAPAAKMTACGTTVVPTAGTPVFADAAKAAAMRQAGASTAAGRPMAGGIDVKAIVADALANLEEERFARRARGPGRRRRTDCDERRGRPGDRAAFFFACACAEVLQTRPTRRCRSSLDLTAGGKKASKDNKR